MVDEPEKSLLQQGKSSKFVFTFFISFVIAKLFGIAFTKIFTNVLTQDEMGQYTIILSAVSLIMSFGALGIPSALNRYAIRYKTKNQMSDLKNFIFTGFITFIIVEFILIMGFLIAYFVSGEPIAFLEVEHYVISLFLVAGIVLAQFISTIFISVATSLQNSRYYSIVVIMRVLLQVPFGILFVIVFKWGVFGLIAGLATSEIAVTIFTGYVIIRDIGVGKFSIGELKKIMEFSLPVYVAGNLWYVFDLVILIYVEYIGDLRSAVDFSFAINQVQNLLLSDTGGLTGTEIIALYRYGALTIVNLVLLAGNVFRMVYSPVIYKYFEKENYTYMRELSVRISKIFLTLMFPLNLALFALSPYLILFFTKSDYLPSLYIIPILLLSIIIQYIGRITNYGHTLYFKNYWNLVVAIISFVFASLTAYFIVPIDGLLGLALAYLVRRALYFVGLFIVSSKYFSVKYPVKTLSLITLIMVISTGIGTLFYFFVFGFLNNNLNILLSFGISTILFCVFVLIFKLINKEEIMFLVNLFTNYFKGIKIPGTKTNSK